MLGMHSITGLYLPPLFSNDINTTADSPVQSECLQWAHNDFNNYREMKTHKIINAGLKMGTVESERIWFVTMQRPGSPIIKFDPSATIVAWIMPCHKRSA